MEYNRGIIPRSRSAERPLVPDRNSVDNLGMKYISNICDQKGAPRVHLGMSNNLSSRRSAIHHERMSESAQSLLSLITIVRNTQKTHFSLPSPTAMILLLSPSQARSLLDNSISRVNEFANTNSDMKTYTRPESTRYSPFSICSSPTTSQTRTG